MIPLLFSPIGRYMIIATALVVILGGVYVKIRSDAVSDYQAEVTSDILKRTQNAIDAGDSAVVGPDRLLESDGHRRD